MRVPITTMRPLSFYSVKVMAVVLMMLCTGRMHSPSPQDNTFVTAERMIRFIFNNGVAPRQYNECSPYEYQRFIDPIFLKINTTLLPVSINTTSTNTTTTITSGNVRTRRRYHHRRQLPSISQLRHRSMKKKYPGKCRDNCAGMATGTCRATDCVGYRRHQHQYQIRTLESDHDDDMEDEDDDYEEEELRYSLTCVEQIDAIHAALDRLIPQRTTSWTSSSYYYYGSPQSSQNSISTSCQRFISKTKRKAECFDDIIYGEIMSFTFWNMNSKAQPTSSSSSRYSSYPSYSSYGSSYPSRIKIKENVTTDGINICHNVPLNIEANVNSCVDTVHFKIRGVTTTSSNNSTNVLNQSNTTTATAAITAVVSSVTTKQTVLLKYERIDNRHPMYLFDTTAFTSTYGGRYLLPGSYTLIAVPDQFRSKKKKLRFNVIKC